MPIPFARLIMRWITALILSIRLIYVARMPLDEVDMAAIDTVFPADAVAGTRYPE